MISEIERQLVELLLAFQDQEGDAMNDKAIAALLETPIKDFGLDSLERMDFVMRIEERYDVELDEGEVIACKNLKDFADLIRRQIG
jgi:acyl carrier protein